MAEHSSPWLEPSGLSKRHHGVDSAFRATAGNARRYDDVLDFVEANHLMGRGLGWVDMHLLVSASSVGEKLLTRDRRLHQAAVEIGLA